MQCVSELKWQPPGHKIAPASSPAPSAIRYRERGGADVTRDRFVSDLTHGRPVAHFPTGRTNAPEGERLKQAAALYAGAESLDSQLVASLFRMIYGEKIPDARR